MPYVASTLSTSMEYTHFDIPKAENGRVSQPAKPVKSVHIKGGANVHNGIQTPHGVLTHVSDEEAELLKTNKLFQTHQQNGFVKILKDEAPIEKVVRDMKVRDESAPLDAAKGDFKKSGRAAGLAPKNTKVE